jgi:hypothetical protein
MPPRCLGQPETLRQRNQYPRIRLGRIRSVQPLVVYDAVEHVQATRGSGTKRNGHVYGQAQTSRIQSTTHAAESIRER